VLFYVGTECCCSLSEKEDCATTNMFYKMKYFIIIDLDGTIIDESSGQLLNGVEDCLRDLKSQQHHLSVCSNNIMASSILSALSLDDLFDMVVGIPSEDFKATELLECWDYYRYANREGKAKQRIKLSNMIFVDNDEEIRTQIQEVYGIRSYSSVNSLYEEMETNKSSHNPAIAAQHPSMTEIKSMYQCSFDKIFRLPQLTIFKLGTVLISSNARLSNHRCGVKKMKFHLYDTCSAFKRTLSPTKVPLSEAVRFGHCLCKFCQYKSW